jgi:NADH-dependent fumarate reductase subunit A
MNEYHVLSFIKDNRSNIIKGINLLNIKDGKLSQIFAKSVIIASGGYAGLYQNFTTNSIATTGEILNTTFNIG